MYLFLAHFGQNIIVQTQIWQINLRNLELSLLKNSDVFLMEDNAGKHFAGVRDCGLKTEELVKNFVINIILFP